MGPFVTRDRCRLVIWVDQRAMVRPSWLTSGGNDWSLRSVASRRVYWTANSGDLIP